MFSVNGVVFVLALDKEQLGHSIRSVYGQGMDSVGYLRRFIDFEYQLNAPELKTYTNSLFRKLKLSEFLGSREKNRGWKNEETFFKAAFGLLASSRQPQLTLREVEQFLQSINIIVRTAEDNKPLHPALLVFLVLCKFFKPDAYGRYISEGGDESELIDYLHEIVPEKIRNGNNQDSLDCAMVEGSLIAAKRDGYSINGNADDSASLHKRRSQINNSNLEQGVRQYLQKVIHYADNSNPSCPGTTVSFINLAQLSHRIEWVGRFQF